MTAALWSGIRAAPAVLTRLLVLRYHPRYRVRDGETTERCFTVIYLLSRIHAFDLVRNKNTERNKNIETNKASIFYFFFGHLPAIQNDPR